MLKPRGLVKICPRVPSRYGRATLERLREGKPPFNLKDWPTGDDTIFRQLKISAADRDSTARASGIQEPNQGSSSSHQG